MSERARTLAETTAERILAQIRELRCVPGQRLPTEREMCQRMGVGRNTVREALKILASRNVLEIRQGAGCFISDKQGVSDDPFGLGMMRDPQKVTRDLMQIRIILEPPIAALAAQNAAAQEVAELEALLSAMEETMRRREDYARQDADFHVKIAQCSHNVVMQNLVPVIARGVLAFAKTVGQTEYEQTLLSHRRIFEYIRQREPFEAEQEMRFHTLFNQNRY